MQKVFYTYKIYYNRAAARDKSSGGGKTLTFKNVWAKLQKSLIFGIVLLSFSKNWECPPPASLDTTGLYKVWLFLLIFVYYMSYVLISWLYINYTYIQFTWCQGAISVWILRTVLDPHSGPSQAFTWWLIFARIIRALNCRS